MFKYGDLKLTTSIQLIYILNEYTSVSEPFIETLLIEYSQEDVGSENLANKNYNITGEILNTK